MLSKRVVYICHMEIKLNIKKAAVYNEVDKTTAYVGSKLMDGNEDTYARVFTTDDDREMLERFWRETCSAVVDEFKLFIKDVSAPENSQTVDDAEIFSLEMIMPSSFDDRLTSSIEMSLFSFFVSSILVKWFAVTNKGDVEYYQNQATAFGNEIRRKVFHRKKPIRIIPNE